MYKYIDRQPIPNSDQLSIAILEDNDGTKGTVSEFMERDRKGFLVRYKSRSILVELDWCNRVKVTGAYPNEVAMFAFVPLFCEAMEKNFHQSASEEFKQIVQQLFSVDFKFPLEFSPENPIIEPS